MYTDLTVIIPTYNCRDFLPACIDSVLAQQYANLEIIVIDDGSTDGSQQWLAQKAQITPQMTVLTQQNKGVVCARNRAIQLAKGKWIAFLDADDTWFNGKLAEQMAYMKTHQGCVLSFTNYDHVDEQGRYIIDCFGYWRHPAITPAKTNKFTGLSDPLNALLHSNIIGTSSVIAKKSALVECGLFDGSLNSASDWDLWLKLAQKGCFAYSTASLMGYLMRQGSITSNRLNRLNAMKTIVNRVKLLAAPATIKKATANIQQGYAEYHREQGDFIKAITHDLKSFYFHPHLRTLKHLCFDTRQLLLPRGTM